LLSPGESSPGRNGGFAVGAPPEGNPEAEGPYIVCLVKPQFESERAQVGKGGIVRDPAVHREVLDKVKCYAADNGLAAVSELESPITGTKGNREFLLLLRPKSIDSGGPLEAGE
jgi:predicted rRNA methylase YqxC with S4 and FtsJ domains